MKLEEEKVKYVFFLAFLYTFLASSCSVAVRHSIFHPGKVGIYSVFYAKHLLSPAVSGYVLLETCVLFAWFALISKANKMNRIRWLVH